MSHPLCRHVQQRGTQCGSPALRNRDFCFYHQHLYDRHGAFRQDSVAAGYLIPGQHIELLPLEDRDSVQLALSMVINSLATGQLEPKRATALLYGLQLASMNCARLTPPPPAHVLREVDQTPGHPDRAPEGALTEPETPFYFDDEFEDDQPCPTS